MKCGGKILFRCGIALGLAWCVPANAIVADSANPYQGIVDRNVFGLKPPPPPPKAPEADKPQPPKITLTGVTTILGNKRALMTATLPAKPGEQAKPQSFILTEGQHEGEIEVLEIDEKIAGGTVKITNYGVPQTLNMEKDTPKLTASAAAPPPMAALNPGGGYVPPPVNPVNPAANNGLKTIPTRTLRLPQAGEHSGVPPSPNSGIAAPVPGFSSVQPQAQPIVGPEEQAINMLAQHVQFTDKGHQMPPLPPPLADVLNGGGQNP